MSSPLKRHPALQPLSREHHQILLLGFKLRQGFRNNIDPKRMMNYCQWFFSSFLLPHLKKEETFLVQCLGHTSELISSLRENHKTVVKAFTNLNPSQSSLKELEQVVISHVRYEERNLFGEVQELLSEEDLQFLNSNLDELNFQDHLGDVFWR